MKFCLLLKPDFFFPHKAQRVDTLILQMLKQFRCRNFTSDFNMFFFVNYFKGVIHPGSVSEHSCVYFCRVFLQVSGEKTSVRSIICVMSKFPSLELVQSSCSLTKPAEAWGNAWLCQQHQLCCLPSFPVFSFPFSHNFTHGRVTRSSQLLRVAEGCMLPAQQGTAELPLSHRLIKEGPRPSLCQPASLALCSCLWLCCFIVLRLAVIPSNGKTCCSLKADGNSFLKEKICLFSLVLLFSLSFIFCL